MGVLTPSTGKLLTCHVLIRAVMGEASGQRQCQRTRSSQSRSSILVVYCVATENGRKSEFRFVLLHLTHSLPVNIRSC